MAKPSTRQELVNYGLRQLGAPVLEINIADEQIDDVLDDTIQYFQERHFDGVIRTYLKYQFTQEDIDRGNKYDPFVNPGITTTAVTYPGNTTATVDTFIENSNYILLPDHIIGVEKVFAPPSATGSGYNWNWWGLGAGGSPAGTCGGFGYLGMGYLGGTDMISFYLAKQWMETYNWLFNPEAQIRFNKRMGRLYLDINWNRLSAGDVIIVDCYRALNPEHYNLVYNDSWVKKHFVASLKKQWGQNLIKFRGTKLPGGIEMNGREIYDEGVKELQKLDEDYLKYEEPPLDLIG